MTAAPRQAEPRLAGEPSYTKSASVVSLGRNVTVSWTKFRTAIRIASVIVVVIPPEEIERAHTIAARARGARTLVEKWRSRHGTHPDRSARHEGPAAALHSRLARGQHHLRGGPVGLRQGRQTSGQGRYQGANTQQRGADKTYRRCPRPAGRR